MDKLAHAEERLGDIHDWLAAAPESKVHRLAVYKAIQEVVEALTDILAMAVRDAGEVPRDDYGNIDRLAKQGRISNAVAADLKEANGLRNRIVHEYNGFWDDQGLGRIAVLAPGLERAVEEVRAWV